MFTVIETPLFQSRWPLYWSEEARGELPHSSPAILLPDK